MKSEWEALQKMTETPTLRGPDNSNVFVINNCLWQSGGVAVFTYVWYALEKSGRIKGGLSSLHESFNVVRDRTRFIDTNVLSQIKFRVFCNIHH